MDLKENLKNLDNAWVELGSNWEESKDCFKPGNHLSFLYFLLLNGTEYMLESNLSISEMQIFWKGL